MMVLEDRIDDRPGGSVLKGSGITVQEILRQLEAGTAPALGAADMVAALAYAALRDPGPALVRGTPRRPGLGGALSEGALAALLPGAERPERLALAAGLLQVHDFWEASHEAAQEADDLGEKGTAAFWHGIAHRREPDPGNASYWFRRVGRHPLFARLGEEARALIRAAAHPVPAEAERLIRGGSWDPFAMIDLCRAARPGSPVEAMVRRLQQRELLALLEASASGAGVG